jgi:hypothetical protein
LPNATIVTASANEHPDLYFALRGGGNNFGILTSFTFLTFTHGKMWGGYRIYTWDKKDLLLEAYHSVTTKGYETDPNAAMFLTFGYNPLHNFMWASAQTMHLHPEPNPPVYDGFRQIEVKADTLRVNALSNFTAETSARAPPGFRCVNPAEPFSFSPLFPSRSKPAICYSMMEFSRLTSRILRNCYKTISYKPSRELNSRLLDVFTEMVEPLKPIKGFVPGITFQPLSASTMKFTKSNGGNAMGLDEEDGPLTSRQFSFYLSPKSDTNPHDQ